MAIAIIDSTSFAHSSWETSTTTTVSAKTAKTAKRSGRRGLLESVIAVACRGRAEETEAAQADPYEASRRRDQATIDHWVRSL